MNDLPPNLPAAPAPRPTAQVAPYVAILGLDLTVTFLLTFGGADLYLAADPPQSFCAAAARSKP